MESAPVTGRPVALDPVVAGPHTTAASTVTQVAAIDLGSNSFHLIVARVDGDRVSVLDRMRETVRLAGGLDSTNRLRPEARARALDCLSRLGQRVRDLGPGNVRVVGTNTLRRARDAEGFLREAGELLGHPVEIISGVEEARLIYLGVAQTQPDHPGTRLVVDIGGGSTEVIVGQGFEPRAMESLYMGCVSLTGTYFPEGRIDARAWRRAVLAARLEVRPVGRRLREMGWDTALGASGTLLAVQRVLTANGWGNTGTITLEGVHRLRKALLAAGSIRRISLPEISDDRAQVLPGGVCVLQGVMEGLEIDRMTVSDGALREGVIYDLLGRIHYEDVRERSIQGLVARFGVDAGHADRVRRTAVRLFAEVAPGWGLDGEQGKLLEWAASLHEIGLAIAHAHYQKHGAYLLQNADLPGFSQQGQYQLAILVGAHRRKLKADLFGTPGEDGPNRLLCLAILLRLAVLMHRSRGTYRIPLRAVAVTRISLHLSFEPEFWDAHPLTRLDLKGECERLSSVGFRLSFS